VFVAGSALLAALQAVVESQGDASLTDGVRRLAALGQVYALDIGEHFWQDVDTPAMLAHAERWLQRYGWKFERSRACSGALGNSP
jgi:NDP-sugar pyrophosphorylase family protein